MGLDISYYSHLTPAPDAPRDNYGEVDYDKYVAIHDQRNLERRAPDLQPGIYSFVDSDGFRAGSYGGYNAWRDELAKFVGYGSAKAVWNARVELDGKPFVELIDFSDCDGVIGPAVSAKLATDFASFQKQADRHPDEYWRSKYDLWRQAFEMAAQGGCVCFH